MMMRLVRCFALVALLPSLSCEKDEPSSTGAADEAKKLEEGPGEGGGAGDVTPRPGHLRFCDVPPEHMDPALATSMTGHRLAAALFDGLARLDRHGRPRPSLAERWESTEDQTEWVFHLRENARWSNGRQIVADDVVFHVARVLHPATRSRNRSAMGQVAGAREHAERLEKKAAGSIDYSKLTLPKSVGVEAVDPQTVVIRFEHPTPDAPWIVASSWFRPTPREALVRWGDAWPQPNHIVTSGPFHLQSTSNDAIELVKAEQFWDRASVDLDRVTVRTNPATERTLQDFREGRCDLTAPNNLPLSVSNEEHLETRLKLGSYFYILNVERLPNRALRRALALSVNREAVMAQADHGYRAASAFTPAAPSSAFHARSAESCEDAEEDDPVLPVSTDGACYRPPVGLAFDKDAARRALQRARNELKADFPDQLTVSYNDLEHHRVIAQTIATQWRDHLGLDIELRPMKWRPFLKATLSGDYEVARMSWIAPRPAPVGGFLFQFRCGQAQNRTGYCDEEFERLLDAAESATNPTERLRFARRAESHLLDAAPVIPLYTYEQRWLRRPYVRGVVLHMTGMSPFSEASIE